MENTLTLDDCRKLFNYHLSNEDFDKIATECGNKGSASTIKKYVREGIPNSLLGKLLEDKIVAYGLEIIKSRTEAVNESLKELLINKSIPKI